ncbi:hypothetical protein [Paraburkholderia antibiotica]|uniref:Uncharacterized protein n=1 Tax=Paraburkholderia antibiotica TaxID=2728839 RepID=A0A7Y0A296_9BURK|nr:hypothetical protein [Paraburkholderia antibiotica]NML35129.1 hypothetical protein [Paraburkholderia antibiotica]
MLKSGLKKARKNGAKKALSAAIKVFKAAVAAIATARCARPCVIRRAIRAGLPLVMHRRRAVHLCFVGDFPIKFAGLAWLSMSGALTLMLTLATLLSICASLHFTIVARFLLAMT